MRGRVAPLMRLSAAEESSLATEAVPFWTTFTPFAWLAAIRRGPVSENEGARSVALSLCTEANEREWATG